MAECNTILSAYTLLHSPIERMKFISHFIVVFFSRFESISSVSANDINLDNCKVECYPSFRLSSLYLSVRFILRYFLLSILLSFVPSLLPVSSFFLQFFLPSHSIPSLLPSFLPASLQSFLPSVLRPSIPFSLLRLFVPSFLSFLPASIPSFRSSSLPPSLPSVRHSTSIPFYLPVCLFSTRPIETDGLNLSSLFITKNTNNRLFIYS